MYVLRYSDRGWYVHLQCMHCTILGYVCVVEYPRMNTDNQYGTTGLKNQDFVYFGGLAPPTELHVTLHDD